MEHTLKRASAKKVFTAFGHKVRTWPIICFQCRSYVVEEKSGLIIIDIKILGNASSVGYWTFKGDFVDHVWYS